MVDKEVSRLSALPPSSDLPPVTVDEVQKLIKAIPRKKAPGSDGITGRVVKILPAQLIALLVAIFNAAMVNCIFPNTWKDATVIGIPKPGKDLRQPSSYRPISLLKILGKLYERVLTDRLRSYVFTNNLMIPEQFGFRAGHSCVHQVHRLTEHILTGLNKTRPKGTGAIFLDVAKAFDKVWHNGLVYKLYQLNVPDRLVLIIRDFLSNRTFRYRVGAEYSSPREIRAGVPQGSVLSPLLFALYVNDIPRTPRVELAMFADDTALYTTGTNKTRVSRLLQSASDTLGDWFRKWRIEVNPDKSALMYFTRGTATGDRARTNMSQITMFGRPIPRVRQVKYLGVILDQPLSFAPHIRAVRSRAALYMNRLYYLIGRRSKMSLKNKLTIYKTCIRPVLTYASVAFAHAAKTHLNRFQTLQSRFLRIAANAPWYVRNVDLHRDCDIPSVSQYIKDASRRYFDKAAHHPNRLVVDAVNYTPTALADPLTKYLRPRHILLLPDDEITAANASPLTDSTQSVTLHMHTSNLDRVFHRTRRRVRRNISHSIAQTTRYQPGR